MLYILSLFIVAAGYYTFTYGIYTFTQEKNRLSGFGVCLLAIVGTVVPIVVMFLKR